MALGAVTILRRYPPKRGVREVLAEIVGEASYTSTGVAIAASVFGLTAITAVEPFPPYPLADRIYIWDRANGKLMAQVISTGLEASGNLSADKIVVHVTGR